MTADEIEKKSLKDTKKLLLKWKNDKNIQELKEFYNTKSYGEILKVERKEEPHSSFIAWLLDLNETHGLDDFAMKKFLDILITYGEDKITKKSGKLYESLLIGNYRIENFYIETEYNIGQSGFIDIFISMDIKIKKYDSAIPINIIIENKVYSTENIDKLDNSKSQTNKYYEHFETENIVNEKFKKNINFYVYLTPLSSIDLKNLQGIPQCECKEFIQINYQMLSDNIFELVQYEDVPHRTKFIVQEYLKSLGKPIEDEKNKGKIMAISTKEKRLLDSFLEEHLDLIITAVNAKIEDPDLDDKARIDLKQTANTLIGTKKNNTKYNFNNKSNLSKGKLVLEVFKKYTDNDTTITFDKLDEYSKTFRNTGVIEKLSNVQNLKKRDKQRYSTKDNEVIKLSDGTEVVINLDWSNGKDDFNRVLQEAKRLDNKFKEVN